jgi:1-aminocyclopropane-1-carboxylate deaminase/D-cysteine desulfhydrase-like pyridoxal-dependent ACC family enzyme
MSSQSGHDPFENVGFPPRIELTTTPTPLERGGPLPSGAQLWVKRDDLTGLGAGGNKARKLEYLCAEALAHNADCLVTVGAAQSNHCRMTAAAGARLGLETHLVLAGHRPAHLEGNQLLSHMFGATLHHTGCDDAQWKELESYRSALTDDLRSQGRRPHSIPIGGSTPMGALGYWRAFDELMSQCQQHGFTPDVIIHTSSSGGTHAGLIAGLAHARAQLRPHCPIIAIGVAKGVALTAHSVFQLAQNTLFLASSDAPIELSDVQIDSRFLGNGYAVPTEAGTAATHWAAHRGAWVLDSVYTAKGFSGLLGLDAEGMFSASQNVVFIHTGGLPSVFAH